MSDGGGVKERETERGGGGGGGVGGRETDRDKKTVEGCGGPRRRGRETEGNRQIKKDRQ